MAVRIVKLVTGEEVIGEVSNVGDEVAIKSPCGVQIMASRSNPEPVVALVPYATYTKDHLVHIDKRNIVWCEDAATEMYNQYNKIFGTGIQLAGV